MKKTALSYEDNNKPSKDRKNKINPIVPLPLSQIDNPKDLVQKKGDFLMYTKTEKGDDVVKLHAGGIKRSAVKYKSTGKIVETTVY